MKKYLVYTFLVINAVPVKAAQADWCNGYVGCGTVTTITDFCGITHAAKKETEATTRSTNNQQQEELDNVPTRDEIAALAAAACENNARTLQALHNSYGEEDAAIAAANTKDVVQLSALLEACKEGSLEDCVLHKTVLEQIYSRSMTSNQRATDQAKEMVIREQKVKALNARLSDIFDAYAAFDALHQEEHAKLNQFNQDRYEAHKLCTEGKACNEMVEAIDQCLADYKAKMQEENRAVKAKLDTTWHAFKQVTSVLNAPACCNLENADADQKDQNITNVAPEEPSAATMNVENEQPEANANVAASEEKSA